MKQHGQNGQIELFDDHLVITREGFLGFLAQGFAGAKNIPYSSIAAVQFRDAGSFVNGFIQLTIVGGVERRGGVLAAGRDENSVTFTDMQAEEFSKLRVEIEERVRRAKASVSAAAPSIADEIEKLASLRDRGILTDAEFQAKKTALLS